MLDRYLLTFNIISIKRWKWLTKEYKWDIRWLEERPKSLIDIKDPSECSMTTMILNVKKRDDAKNWWLFRGRISARCPQIGVLARGFSTTSSPPSVTLVCNAGTDWAPNVSKLDQWARINSSDWRCGIKACFNVAPIGGAAASHDRVSCESIGDESTTTILWASGHLRTHYRGLSSAQLALSFRVQTCWCLRSHSSRYEEAEWLETSSDYAPPTT